MSARNPDTTIPTRRPTTARPGTRTARSSAVARATSCALHQADLIENLLPRLALDIGTPAPTDLADLFDRRSSTMSGSKSDLAAANI